MKTCEVFLCFLAIIFLGSILLTSQWLLCIHCFTSLVSFTGFYSEDEPEKKKNLLGYFRFFSNLFYVRIASRQETFRHLLISPSNSFPAHFSLQPRYPKMPWLKDYIFVTTFVQTIPTHSRAVTTKRAGLTTSKWSLRFSSGLRGRARKWPPGARGDTGKEYCAIGTFLAGGDLTICRFLYNFQGNWGTSRRLSIPHKRKSEDKFTCASTTKSRERAKRL